jgi:hypothetical protein
MADCVVLPPDTAAGTVGAAVNGGSGWLIEAKVGNREHWVRGVAHSTGGTEVVALTPHRPEAAWWPRVGAARVWADRWLKPTRGDRYDVVRTKFPTGFGTR